MSNFPEVGYTPANLRYLIELKGITQKEAAKICGTSDINFRRWLMPVDAPNHRDMPMQKWNDLLKALV
jgi:hypothetical protein